MSMTMRGNQLLSLAILLAATCAAQATYSYDNGGHLTAINYGAAGTVVYGYDPAGNLTSRTLVTAGKSTITSVNTAGGGAVIAQNGWIEIKGVNLVPATTPAAGVIWSTAPSFASGQMPTNLQGVSVTVDGKPAYVYFYCSAVTSTVCSADQVNVLTPLDNTVGPVQVVVTSGSTSSSPLTVNMQAVAPSFLRFGASSYVVATHADNSLLGPASLYPGASTPAKANEEIVTYAVGFGLPSSPLTLGSANQSGTLTPLPLCTIGGNNATVAFAGLNGPGLYQLNLIVPSGASAGDNAVSCSYGGSTTPAGDLLSVGQ
jgi:uncharacterized protein (TIGR03437 family)